MLERDISGTGLTETEQPFRSGEMDSHAFREMKKRLSQLLRPLRTCKRRTAPRITGAAPISCPTKMARGLEW